MHRLINSLACRHHAQSAAGARTVLVSWHRASSTQQPHQQQAQQQQQHHEDDDDDRFPSEPGTSAGAQQQQQQTPGFFFIAGYGAASGELTRRGKVVHMKKPSRKHTFFPPGPGLCHVCWQCFCCVQHFWR